MTDQHPITPPPELVEQWRKAPEFSALSPCVMVTVTNTKLQDIATQAAQWGADQEVGACCQWLVLNGYDLVASKFRAARRPKPPSLKKQALALIDGCNDPDNDCLDDDALATIRRAVEQLDD
jgi:hypothetical protein